MPRPRNRALPREISAGAQRLQDAGERGRRHHRAAGRRPVPAQVVENHPVPIGAGSTPCRGPSGRGHIAPAGRRHAVLVATTGQAGPARCDRKERRGRRRAAPAHADSRGRPGRAERAVPASPARKGEGQARRGETAAGGSMRSTADRAAAQRSAAQAASSKDHPVPITSHYDLTVHTSQPANGATRRGRKRQAIAAT